MRISNQTVVRNYTKNLNRNLGQLNKYSTMVQTQRRFMSMAEDASSGVRAMQLRRTMSNVDAHADTAATVRSQFNAAEDQMTKINTLAQEITTRYTNALNGTNGEDEHQAFVNEISQFRDQILACANSQFAGRFSFGGTNTSSPPFTAQGNTLYYNGIDVSQMADENGLLKPEYQYLKDDAIFVDIGLGLKEDANGTLVESSAFKSSLVGIDLLGFGEDNLYLLCNQVLDALNDPNFTNNAETQGLLTKMQDATTSVLLKITDIGTQAQYLDFTVENFKDQTVNLAERQNALEFIDPSEAIMYFKMQEYSYNAALQMGQRLLQPTLFNFIN